MGQTQNRQPGDAPPRRRSLGALLSAAIVVVWLALLSQLFWRTTTTVELPPAQEGSTPAVVAAIDERDVWMGLYQKDKKIGFSHTRLSVKNDHIDWREETFLHVLMMGQAQRVNLTLHARAGRDLQLHSATATLKTEAANGTIRAQVVGAELQIRGTMNGETIEQNLKLTQPVSLASLARHALSRESPRAGLAVERSVFDPLTQQAHTVHFRIEGQAVEPVPGQAGVVGWRASQEMRGMRSTLWLDTTGDLLREEGPMGLVLVREAAETATLVPEDPTLDITTAAALPVQKAIADPRHLCELTLRIDGADLSFVESGGAVRRDGASLTVRSIRAAEMKDYDLPYKGTDLTPYLESEPFVESNDPRIREAAAKALGDAKTAVAATRAVVGWVYANLAKEPVASVPDALQVLRAGRGDCNEHAVLLAALARALGIPARIVSGLIYNEGSFLFHAWNEVWLGEWVPVDSTLDQVPADATHVRLAIGGIEAQSVLARVAGSATVEVGVATPCP